MVFLIALVAISVARWDVLHSPPWQDQATGLWTEADFLAETRFDFWRLRYQENHYFDQPSGARSYMISAQPAMIAALMLALPSIDSVIVLVRLGSFVCGALSLAIVWILAAPIAGRAIATLATVALGATPMFITQVEHMGMDVPLMLWTLITIWLLANGRYRAAALASAVAFLMKSSGQLVTTAGAALVLFKLLTSRHDDRATRTWLWQSLALFTLVFVAETLFTAWGDTTILFRLVAPWPSTSRLPWAMLYTTPDVVALLAIASVATLIVGIAYLRQNGWRRALAAATTEQTAVLASWILIGLALFAAWRYLYCPRYFLCALPGVYLCLVAAITALPAGHKLAMVGLCCVIVGNLANQYGRFFPDIARVTTADLARDPSLTIRSCLYRERSREYLAEHLANQRTIDYLVEHHSDRLIFVEPPFLFLMTRPRLGYVDRPLHAVTPAVYDPTVQQVYAQLVEAQRRGNPDAGPLFVQFAASRITLPPPADDEILYSDQLTPPLLVYQPRFAPELVADQHKFEEAYLDSTWNTNWIGERVQTRWPFLMRTGRLQRARAELDQALGFTPYDASLRARRLELEALESKRAAGVESPAGPPLSAAIDRKSTRPTP
ncbi:MAG: glycosyltransferase family 39 protein [Pirellulales bacterium]|nr:glycosyltransferase family 39 protein [Pirellulales bacterium]